MTMPFWNAAADALAQTIVHFVWQGFALWIMAACVLHVVQVAGPKARYGVDCLLLACLAACPVATFCVVVEHPAAPPVVSALSLAPVEVDGDASTTQSLATKDTFWTRGPQAWAGRIEPYRRWLLAVWLAGSGMLAVRLV